MGGNGQSAGAGGDHPSEQNHALGVELIASGYAWTCPECSRTEYENEVPAVGSVHCGRCGGSFPLTRVVHRVEPGALGALSSNGDGRALVSPRSDLESFGSG
jgi:hypothetical protein